MNITNPPFVKVSVAIRAEIDAIVNNPEAPTFANTILAYEKSGELLDRVTTVFGNLRSAETNDDLQKIAGR